MPWPLRHGIINIARSGGSGRFIRREHEMGLFSRNYDKPGPGVNKDEPRKKGFRRFVELISRDFSNLVKMNVLFCGCLLPSVALFFLGLYGLYPPVTLVLSIIAAYPVGPAFTASQFCISKMLCDVPGFLWHDWKRKFRETRRQAAVPGIFCTVFTYGQILLWVQILIEGAGGGAIWTAIGFCSLLLFSLIAPYIFLHLAYVDLKMMQIVRNSVLIAIANLPRSFMGALVGGIAWLAFILFYPVSVLFAPLIVLFVFSVSWLLNLMWVWPRFDKVFSVEETIRNRRREQLEQETTAAIERE